MPATPRQLQTPPPSNGRSPATAPNKRVSKSQFTATNRRHSFSGSSLEGPLSNELTNLVRCIPDGSLPATVALLVKVCSTTSTADSGIPDDEIHDSGTQQDDTDSKKQSANPSIKVEHATPRKAQVTSSMVAIESRPRSSSPTLARPAPSSSKFRQTLATAPPHRVEVIPAAETAHSRPALPPAFDMSRPLVAYDYSGIYDYGSVQSYPPNTPSLAGISASGAAEPTHNYHLASPLPWFEVHPQLYYPINGETGAYQTRIDLSNTSTAPSTPTHAHFSPGVSDLGCSPSGSSSALQAVYGWNAYESSQNQYISPMGSQPQLYPSSYPLPPLAPTFNGPTLIEQLEQGVILRRTGVTKFFDLQKVGPT